MNTSAMSIAGAAMVLLALLGCSTTPKENYGQAYETSLTQAEVMMQILRTLDSGDIAKTRHMAMIVVHVDLSSLSDYLPKENRSAEQRQEEMVLAREVLDYMLRHREQFNPRLLSLRMGMRALRDILTDEEDVQRLTELSDYFAGVEARLPSNP